MSALHGGLIGLLVIGALPLAGGCATTAATPEPIVAPTGKSLFPAVYRAVQTVSPGAVFSSVDLAKERYHVQRMEFSDGLSKRRLDVEVTIDQGLVECTSNHEEQYDEAKSLWISSSLYVFKSARQVRNALCEEVRSALTNEGLYAVSKQAALSDLVFVHRCVAGLDKAALDAFVAQQMKGVPLQLILSVRTVTPVDRKVNGIGYHFQVDCLPGPEEGAAGMLDHDVLSLYTSDPAVVASKPGAVVTLSVEVAAMAQTAPEGLTWVLVPARDPG